MGLYTSVSPAARQPLYQLLLSNDEDFRFVVVMVVGFVLVADANSCGADADYAMTPAREAGEREKAYGR